jgi:hypothetical protein
MLRTLARYLGRALGLFSPFISLAILFLFFHAPYPLTGVIWLPLLFILALPALVLGKLLQWTVHDDWMPYPFAKRLRAYAQKRVKAANKKLD